MFGTQNHRFGEQRQPSPLFGRSGRMIGTVVFPIYILQMLTSFLLLCQLPIEYMLPIHKNLHITFQVTDVLQLRIRACVARPATAKCAGAEHHKGTKCRLVFCGSRAAERRRSSYRLLCDVKSAI